jgi:hypothetical protein
VIFGRDGMEYTFVNGVAIGYILGIIFLVVVWRLK